MKKPSYKQGDVVSSWKLNKYLGAGGNGEVWEAIDGKGGNVALKILKNKDSASYQYKRFQSEIEILTSLGNREGILPLLDFKLPGTPTRDNPACFSMPVAIPIKEVLDESQELEAIVDGILTVATTLESLAAKDISHRDIKPENLFLYEDKWVVGDFGIASFPGKEALTVEGNKLGPMYYHAPEMLNDPVNANGKPADVYSLAKTLWVLATGQNFPPQGQHLINEKPMTIGGWVTHNRVYLLDRLIEKATSYTPQDRPTMSEFVKELRSWTAPNISPKIPESLTDEVIHIKSAILPAQKAEQIRQNRIKLGQEALQMFVDQMKPLADAIAEIGLSSGSIDNNATIVEAFTSLRGLGKPGLLWEEGRCIVSQTPGTNPIYWWCGVGVGVFEDGKAYLRAAHIIRQGNLSSNIFGKDTRLVDAGSAEEAKTINELVAGLVKSFDDAVRQFSSMIK